MKRMALVGMALLVAATVALNAAAALARPAEAQDADLIVWCGSSPSHPEVGEEITIRCDVTSIGANAEEVIFYLPIRLAYKGEVNVAPRSFSVSTTRGSCDYETPSPDFYAVGCRIGDLPVDTQEGREEATVTVRFVPTTPGTIYYLADARANNTVHDEKVDGEIVVSASGSKPGGDDDNDKPGKGRGGKQHDKKAKKNHNGGV